MFTLEAAKSLDPLGLYSLGRSQSQEQSNNSSDLWLELVGMPRRVKEPESQKKTRPKRRVQNIFSGQWEWVE
jgi:hypothetical protein